MSHTHAEEALRAIEPLALQLAWEHLSRAHAQWELGLDLLPEQIAYALPLSPVLSDMRLIMDALRPLLSNER